MRLTELARPCAIAMWDFSWLERRWSGAGYEDWPSVLDELAQRGYDAVRIDAYPHLLHFAEPTATHTIKPVWSEHNWGAPYTTQVQVWPALKAFMQLCAERQIKVALSSWFRQDSADLRMQMSTPEKLAETWVTTLGLLEQAGLLDNVLYVDLCNEWPQSFWTPFLQPRPPDMKEPDWHHPVALEWSNAALKHIRAAYPQFDYGFSWAGYFDPREWDAAPGYDLADPHIWLANCTRYHADMQYQFENFDPAGYEKMIAHGPSGYAKNREAWLRALGLQIEWMAAWSQRTGTPLATTEGWSTINYKDAPGLPWDWVKEANAFAVEKAAATGRWAAICTSNFCGPQFVGMWRDLAHHQRLTELIKSSPMPR